MSPPLVSIVSPACNEEQSLEALYLRIAEACEAARVDWEWIVVDDHSDDGTFEVITRLAASDRRVRGVRLSRNFGSHAATLCGLRRASGKCAIAMAADLQDPPELIPELIASWKSGAQVVTTIRTERAGERASTVWFSRTYLWIMRNIGGLERLPPGSGTYVLLDRRAIESLGQFSESNLALNTLVSWIGFRTASVSYEQEPRLHGKSNWTLRKKVALLFDSLAGHSFFPVRVLGVAGLALILVGLGAGAWLVATTPSAGAVSGWQVAVALILTLSGVQLLMFWMLGEYLWRTLIEVRRRPQYLIEQTTEPSE